MNSRYRDRDRYLIQDRRERQRQNETDRERGIYKQGKWERGRVSEQKQSEKIMEGERERD